MSYLRATFVISLLCLGNLPCFAEPTTNTEAISKAEVTALFAKIDQAIPDKDIKTIADSLSDSVVISGNYIFDGHPMAFNVGKSEYIAQLTKNWSLITNYSYKRTNQVITLSGNKAEVTADVNELISTQQKTISVKSQQATLLEKENGKLVAVKITVRGVSK